MGEFFSENNGNNVTPESNSYGNYYRPVERKSHVGVLLIFLLLIIITMAVLWFGGFLKPENKTASYETLEEKLCNASLSYVNNNKKDDLDIPDKVIYVRVNELVKSDLIEANLVNPLTGEQISLKTDIKLTVIDGNNAKCDGIAWPEDDKIPPTITLNGDVTVTITNGSSYSDPGATATDNRDGDITSKITRSGTVNLNQAGTYYINYIVEDRAGNLSTKVIRTIIVQ